jgi:hypothetical protein
MGGLFGSSNAKQPTAVGSLQFQTSQQGGVIPLVYGTTRVAPNLIEYDDFTATKASGSGKGKGGGAGKGGGTQYDYSASIIFGVCQGPIGAVLQVWFDKNVTVLSGFDPNATLYTGADGQSGDPYWQTKHAIEYLNYSGTANVVANNHPLGTTATLPNVNFEVGSNFVDAPNGLDGNPATIVRDYLTNARYGAGFPSSALDPGMTDHTSISSYWTYCMAAGLFLSPQLDQQQEAQQHLADISSLTNSAVVWSGGVLKVIPYGDEAITTAYTNVQISGVPAVGAVLSLTFTDAALAGSPRTVSYTVESGDTLGMMAGKLAQTVNADNVLAAFGVRASGGQGQVTVYQLAPAGTTAITASGLTVGSPSQFSFTPVTTIQYILGDDDFIVQASSVGTGMGAQPGGPALRSGASPVTGGFTDDPVHITRSTPADAMNSVRVEYRDRANNYNSTIVESFDQASIDLYGIRRDTSLKATAIADAATALTVAQLQLQRGLYFRNTYTFQLGWKYCLLEPMDLVQISDARLGAAGLTVRITAVEEDDEGTLAVTAEDFVPGWSTVGWYPAQAAGAGFVPNWSAPSGNVNTPLIFEPPSALLSGDLEIWIALSGPPGWGGAQVWISSDNSSYAYAGAIGQPATMGALSASLGSYGGAEPDNTNTLAVDLTESQGQLTSVSATDAQNLVTLCYVGGELLAYQTATLTASYKYNLTTLWRGAFGSTIGSQSSGAQFARLDGAVGRFPYPTTLVGQTIYLKFLSFNNTGGAVQSLASVSPYTYVVTGGGKAAVSATVSGQFIGNPAANTVLQRFVFARGVNFPTGLSGSYGSAGTAPSTTAVAIAVQKNGVQVGTMNFAVGATTATFTMASATSFSASDVLSLVMPAIADAAFANLAWNLVGNA